MGMGGFPPTWLRQVSPLLHKTTLTRVVFETEASGGSNAGGLPTLPFPLSLPSPFPFPLHFRQTSGREGRSSEREVPRLSPTDTTLTLITE